MSPAVTFIIIYPRLCHEKFLGLFFSGPFRATSTASVSSQARGRIRASVCLRSSHSSTRSELSATYTVAHSKAGSLTHWVGPGIKPESSWILVGSLTTEPQQELQKFLIFMLLSLSVSYCRTSRFCPTVRVKNFLMIYLIIFAFYYFHLNLQWNLCWCKVWNMSSFTIIFFLWLNLVPMPFMQYSIFLY